MLTRDEVLAAIDAAYAARVRGDKEALAQFWAADASFALPGDRAAFAALHDPGLGARETVEQLIDRVEFKDLERVAAVVEGNRAAVLWRATIAFAGKEPVETMLYDLFELTDAGKLRALTQFADTALVARMAG